jgi:hypothetical protein
MRYVGRAERGRNSLETLLYVIDGHAMELPGIQDGRKTKIEHTGYNTRRTYLKIASSRIVTLHNLFLNKF